MTDFICATPLFQANSCPQGATHRAAVVSAAVHLNDVSLQTNQVAVGHGFPATGLALLKPLFLPGG